MSERMFDLAGRRVWVAGHRGMVGSALVRRLMSTGCEILTVSRGALDLRRQSEVEAWMAARRPDVVFLAAATVGGIAANLAKPAAFCHDNIAIASNVIAASARFGVERLMFLGSACAYPGQASQPMTEDMLMTGAPEPSNAAFAMAKLAGMALCEAFRRQHGHGFFSVIPTNLYGPGDNADPASSHVVPAMIRKVLRAKAEGGAVEIWGTGTPLREFLHVDDAADAMVFLMQREIGADVVNIGGGEVVSIGELARLIAGIVGFTGAFRCDASRPDGMARKWLDGSRLEAMGWRPAIGLRAGLAATCRAVQDEFVSPVMPGLVPGIRGAAESVSLQ